MGHEHFEDADEIEGLGDYPREPLPLPDEGEELIPGEMYVYPYVDYELTNEAERAKMKELRSQWLDRQERSEV